MLNKIKQIFKDKKIYKKPIVIIISILIMSSGIFASFKIIQNKNNQEPQEVMAQKLKKVERKQVEAAKKAAEEKAKAEAKKGAE